MMNQWSVIYVFITSAVLTVSETKVTRWYQGCYDLNLGSADPVTSGVSGQNPVACCRDCKAQRYEYAAVVGRTSCQCLSSLPQQPLPSESCTIRCEDVRLWCGGQFESGQDRGRGRWRASVYLTSGPYLLNVTSHVMEPASYVSQPVSIKSVIQFGGPPDITAGLRNLEGPLNRVNVTCQAGGDTKRRQVVADSVRVRSDCIFIFNENGTFHIDITARSVLSLVTTTVIVTVHLPVPQGLQLSLVTPTRDRPSCTPNNSTLPNHGQTVLVFANETARFEASLSVGENLTFKWTLNDLYDQSRTVTVPNSCVDRGCTTSKQDYVFTQEGRYKLQVTVTSDLGSLTDDLHVVAVARVVSHVTLTCQEPASRVMAPGGTARFLVTMMTTDRQNTTLEVDYGDGADPASYLIVDRRGRMLGIPQTEDLSDQVLLTADYGKGCHLRLEIDHVYVNPGVFIPTVHVTNNHTEVSVLMDQPITVQEALLGLTIQGPIRAAVGQEVTFVAEFSSQSQQATITWTIKSETGVIYDDTSFIKSLTYTFQKPGLFTVEVQAQNEVNSKNETIGITIHQNISGLQLTLSGKPCIKTGETVSFNASVAQGSGVVFEWDFGDEEQTDNSYIVENNESSVSNHTFNRPGLYVIEVHAYNDISRVSVQSAQLIVEDPIETLLVESSSPTLLGEDTAIEAVVTEGTGVKFLMKYNKTVFNRTDSLYRAIWRGKFELGVHRVEVVAQNNVSTLHRVVEVEVEKGVEKVAVLTGMVTVIGEKAIFEARLGKQDLLSDRQDLLYTWKINDELAAITRCPVIDRVFTTLEDVRLEVNVSNKVSSSDDKQKFTVQESSDKPRFVQGAVWDVRESTVFQMINLPPSDKLKKLKMKSCKVHCQFEDVPIAANVTWRNQYEEPGVYEVDANIVYKTSNSVQVRTVVVVQERIVGLTLTGPPAIKLYETSPEAEWTARVENGTHEIYNWTVLGQSVITTSNKFSCRFNQAGTYNISVNVTNSLGWEVQSSAIIAEYPIVRLELKVVPRLRREVSPLTLIVHGGPMTVVNVSLGNGSALILQEGDARLVKEERMGAATGQHGPTTKYTISLRFENVGHYRLVLNASNHVSFMVATKVMVVDEPITGVRVRSASPRIVRRGTTVVVNATVATGKNVTFDWDFSDEGDPTVHTHNNVSVARHVFEEIGEYAVTVYVTGPAYTRPIIAHLPFNFTVGVPIEDVTVYKSNGIGNGSDWASLQPPSHNQTATTGPVYFTAEALRGSNIQFTFYFGDGEWAVVSGERLVGEPVKAEVWHNYTKDGTYLVRVMASNPLGNETSPALPLHVQVPPIGLQLLASRQLYRIPLGNLTTFTANLSHGTGVSYDWDMGDLTEYKDAGPTVSHQYKSTGTFVLGIKAYNKAGSEFIETEVEVTQAILGVNFSIIDGNPHQTKTVVRFRAIPYPEHVWVEHYVWDFGERDEPERQVTSSLVQHSYDTYGSFTVHVKAFNAVGHKMSLPQQVQIVQPLTPVQLIVKGETLIGQQVRLQAYHYEGSDVNYTWDFGDNISVVGQQAVQHIYHRVGRYMIRVTAANPFGTQTDSKSVFVLTRPCAAPEIVFHGERWAVVARTQDIKQEADVRINCSLSSSINYTWSIRDSLSGQPVQIHQFIHDPVLYLPRRTLSYANYTITLRVDMDGTIVYSTKDTSVKVVPTPLVAVVSGGLQRQVSRNETIVLDGSTSHDPDHLGFRNLSYRWGCYQLLKPDQACFHGNTVLPDSNTTTVLTIPGRAFIPRVTDFVFNLTVWRPGRPPSNTSQVLQMEDRGIIDVAVKCPQCEDTIVNSDQRLVLQAEHRGQQEEDLQYSWDLAVHKSDHTPASAHDNNECVKADGSSYHNLRTSTNSSGNGTGTGVTSGTKQGGNGSGKASSQPQTGGGNKTLTSTGTTNAKTSTLATSTTTRPPRGHAGQGQLGVSEGAQEGDGAMSLLYPVEAENNQGRPAGSNPGPPPPAGLLDGINEPEAVEGPSGSRGGHESGSAAAAPASGRRPGSDSSPANPSPTTLEARGSGRGSGSGISPDGRRLGDNGRKDSNQELAGGSQGGTGHGVVDGISQNRTSRHIINIMRTPVILRPEQTTTGVHQRALVIKQGVLKQGRTYIIRVRIWNKKTGINGTAMAYVKVNESPSLGACSLKPDSGTEMKTTFRVVCLEWWDDNTPRGIRYEVSYSLNEGKTQDLVYQGHNHQINFQLPAGSAEYKNIVNVTISILDKYNARTTVCNQPVYVRPLTFGTNNLTEVEAIYELVGEENGTLQKFISKGDNRNVRLHAQLVAHKLNRLPRDQNSAQASLRARIRTTVLQKLKGLPMRDEYEVQQTTSAVATSTAVSEELQEQSLQYASDILEEATERMTELATVTKYVDTSIIMVAIQGTSNIMEATSGGGTRKQLTASKDVIQKLQRTVRDLIKTELTYTVVGEEPVRRVTEYLDTYSGRFKTRQHANIIAESTTFTLPADLNAILDRNLHVKGQGAANQSASDCYETLVVNYRRNPFTYGKGREVQSQVASLSLFSCDTNQIELEVRNLSSKNEVTVTLPKVPSEVEHIGNYTLHKHQMNIHQFNVSLDPKDKQSFQILIEMEPVTEGRLFPIALLLSADRPPTPTKYQYQRVFPASANSLHYFLPPYSLNESTVYYLGVVDARYDAGRPRPGEVRERHYSLRLWHGECVYWDDKHDVWSNTGCSLQKTSTYTTAQCRCNHLTAFGAHFSLVPNDLDFANIEDFFDLNENPVTFTLVSCILGVYLLLLVLCIRADNHNELKGAIVHLIDNVPVDRHKYAITLETGMRRGAGTTAKVSLVLHGQEGMSETRELISESGQPLFERNSRDTFIITLPDSLGEIWKVQIWHNNAGPSPSWYLSRVIVKDLHAGSVYYFSSENWFAVEEEDGKVERELLVLEAGLGFVKVMWAKGTQYVADYHLWFSLLMSPSYSRFTRAQRLTCCLSLALSYMAVNCAWYQTNGSEYRGEFGLIDLSWRALAVGCITSLIVLPVNVLLVFIFRRSKVKRVCIEEPPDRKYHVTKRESVTSLDSTMRLLQPVVTPSIFDQSMLNWQNLQDWAQRQWAKRYQQPSADRRHEAVKPANREAECGRKQECETDQTSSGFEDCLSHDRAGGQVLTDKSTRPMVLAVQVHNQPPQHPTEHALTRQYEETRLRKQQEMQSHLLRGVRSRKPGRFFLPHCCLYFGWALAIAIIISCATITILFGFRFGRTKSIMWLQSLFFSFIQCVFITHPFVVLIMSVYTAVKYRSDLSVFDHRDDGVIEQQINNTVAKPRETQHEDDEDVNLAEGIAARQRSRYLRFARPPQEKQLIESRKKIMKEKKAMAVLEESVGVVVLLVLLVIIAFSKDMTTAYRLNKALDNILAKTGPVPFESLTSTADWFQWTQTGLLDAIYHHPPPGGASTNHDQMYVGNSAVVGRVNVRQLRVTNQRCRLPDKYNIFPICHHGYDYGSRDEKPFGVNHTWRYHDNSVTKSTSVRGRHGHYDGGGYRLTLAASREVSLHRLRQLQHTGWIDENTRAVIVEFTLYNPPSNLFSSVSLLLELPPSGGVFTQTRTMSAHLYKYTTAMDNLVLACELLLTVVALYKLHWELGEVARLKKSYVRNPWKSLEVVALLLLLAYVSCFIYRFMLVNEVVEVLRATYHEQFVDVAYISYWDQILRSFLGFIILLMAVQSLRLLRNRKVFAKFGGVYRKAGLEIASIGVMFVVWACAYSCLGGALYGAATYNFSRLDLALTTVMGLMTGHNSVAEFNFGERVGSQIFLVSFLILAVGSLTAYMVAVLSFHYKTYREEGLPSLSTHEAFVFLWNKIRRALAINCTRKSGKEEEEEEGETLLPAEFTMAEVEYQVDEMLFKMNALTGCSSLPEKPPTYFTDSDCTYGTGDDGISSGGSEHGRPFDDDRFEHRLHKIEDNLMAHDPHWAQLLKLEAIGANLLSQEREKQVRSALEFEIFRQLQMQRRHGSADLRSLPSDNGQVIIHRLSSLSSGGGTTASSGDGSGASSRHGSPTVMTANNKLHKTFSKTSNNASPPPPPKSSTARDGGVQQRHLVPPGGASSNPGQPSRRDALILQNISKNLDSSSPEDGIPLRDITQESTPVSAPAAPPTAEAAAATKTSETSLQEDPVSTSSCSSGGAEVQYIVTQGQPKGQPKGQPEHRSLESLTKPGKGKPKGAGAGAGSATEKTALSYENLYGDTSSGSERDAALRATTKARSLRKTKSRGKGKGRSRLTPVEGLDLDDFGIDNQGYIPEADPKADTVGGVRVGQRQCWT